MVLLCCLQIAPPSSGYTGFTKSRVSGCGTWPGAAARSKVSPTPATPRESGTVAPYPAEASSPGLTASASCWGRFASTGRTMSAGVPSVSRVAAARWVPLVRQWTLWLTPRSSRWMDGRLTPRWSRGCVSDSVSPNLPSSARWREVTPRPIATSISCTNWLPVRALGSTYSISKMPSGTCSGERLTSCPGPPSIDSFERMSSLSR